MRLLNPKYIYRQRDKRTGGGKKGCFLVREGKLVNFTRTFKGLNFTGDFVNLTEDKTTIIERIKKGEFIVLADDSMQYPMSSLGSVEIFGYDFVYHSCSEYACKKAKNIYLPAYVFI